MLPGSADNLRGSYLRIRLDAHCYCTQEPQDNSSCPINVNLILRIVFVFYWELIKGTWRYEVRYFYRMGTNR